MDFEQKKAAIIELITKTRDSIAERREAINMAIEAYGHSLEESLTPKCPDTEREEHGTRSRARQARSRLNALLGDARRAPRDSYLHDRARRHRPSFRALATVLDHADNRELNRDAGFEFSAFGIAMRASLSEALERILDMSNMPVEDKVEQPTAPIPAWALSKGDVIIADDPYEDAPGVGGPPQRWWRNRVELAGPVNALRDPNNSMLLVSAFRRLFGTARLALGGVTCVEAELRTSGEAPKNFEFTGPYLVGHERRVPLAQYLKSVVDWHQDHFDGLMRVEETVLGRAKADRLMQGVEALRAALACASAELRPDGPNAEHAAKIKVDGVPLANLIDERLAEAALELSTGAPSAFAYGQWDQRCGLSGGGEVARSAVQLACEIGAYAEGVLRSRHGPALSGRVEEFAKAMREVVGKFREGDGNDDWRWIVAEALRHAGLTLKALAPAAQMDPNIADAVEAFGHRAHAAHKLWEGHEELIRAASTPPAPVQAGVPVVDALYGFLSWLSTLSVPVTVGAQFTPYDMHDLLRHWLGTQGIEDETSQHYPNNLKAVSEPDGRASETPERADPQTQARIKMAFTAAVLSNAGRGEPARYPKAFHELVGNAEHLTLVYSTRKDGSVELAVRNTESLVEELHAWREPEDDGEDEYSEVAKVEYINLKSIV